MDKLLDEMIMSSLSSAVSIFAVADLVCLFSSPHNTFSEDNKTLCNVTVHAELI